MKHSLRKKDNLPRLLVTALIAILVATGLSLIGNGLWIKAKAQLAQILLNQAFERVQERNDYNSVSEKPWHWADIKPYARLNAPRLKKSQVILGSTSGEALAFGPGHLPQTPQPGETGTSVLAAHRDTHFSWIKDLKSGDNLEVERADGTSVLFKVTGHRIARYDNSGIDISSFNSRLALTTCYPFDAKTRGPLRYIVEAELIDSKIASVQK